MNKYAISTVTCLTLLFTSCRQDVIDTQIASEGLRIRAQIENPFGETRSIPTGTSEEQTQFKDGDVVAVSYYDVKDKAHKRLAHYRKSGSEWQPTDGGIKWIQGADLLVVDAYYPAEHSNELDGSNQASWVDENALFVVPTDQRSTNADNDISWADHMTCRVAVKKEDREKPIELNFKRWMAKVNFRVTSLDDQWDPNRAWVSIDKLHTHTGDVRDFFPKGGEELMLNEGEATCLLPLGVWYAGSSHKFATISVYESKGLVTGKITMELNKKPIFEAGKATTINLKIGKKRVDMEQFTIEPWGGKVAITDAVGPKIPVMIVKDGLAHIYLDRVTNGTVQIADSIRSAENEHRVHDLVFYGNAAGKLTLDANNNMIRSTTVRSLDLSHVTDLTAVTDRAFKVVNEATDFTKFEELLLPASVKTIGSDAFLNNKMMKRIVTPGVEEIAVGAFKNCRSLLAVSFPKVKKINKNTFEECVSMADADFPIAEEIGEHAFKNASLSGGVDGKVKFPKVKRIYPEAFAYSSLTGGAFIGEIGVEPITGMKVKDVLVFPEVEQIDKRAFLGCSRLIAISFPKAVRFHDYIFSGCGSLSALKITAQGQMRFLGENGTPFGRDYENYPSSHAGEDYNPARNDPWHFGVGTLYVNVDKKYNVSTLSIRVRSYVHHVGYGDNRGQAEFGDVWPDKNATWRELIYVDEHGQETWAHLIH